jgi:hypothetical protein
MSFAVVSLSFATTDHRADGLIQAILIRIDSALDDDEAGAGNPLYQGRLVVAP